MWLKILVGIKRNVRCLSMIYEIPLIDHLCSPLLNKLFRNVK
jgi:hypothetical protein